MLCVSGFVDDVTFSYNGLYLYGGVTLHQQTRCNVVNGVTPLLRGTDIDCVVS